MATHTYHPDIAEQGLADDCPRCAELARQPLELDVPNFVAAWERMLRVQYAYRFPGEPRETYRTANEAALGGLLYTWSVFLERYTPVDPDEMLAELRTMAAFA